MLRCDWIIAWCNVLYRFTQLGMLRHLLNCQEDMDVECGGGKRPEGGVETCLSWRACENQLTSDAHETQVKSFRVFQIFHKHMTCKRLWNIAVQAFKGFQTKAESSKQRDCKHFLGLSCIGIDLAIFRRLWFVHDFLERRERRAVGRFEICRQRHRWFGKDCKRIWAKPSNIWCWCWWFLICNWKRIWALGKLRDLNPDL